MQLLQGLRIARSHRTFTDVSVESPPPSSEFKEVAVLVDVFLGRRERVYEHMRDATYLPLMADDTRARHGGDRDG